MERVIQVFEWNNREAHEAWHRRLTFDFSAPFTDRIHGDEIQTRVCPVVNLHRDYSGVGSRRSSTAKVRYIFHAEMGRTMGNREREMYIR